MALVRDLQTNFSSGQLDAHMLGRSDTTMYKNGASNLVNSSPLIEGGIERRGGFAFIADLTAAVGAAARQEIFKFNDDQEYLFFFENTKVTIYLPNGTLAQTITSCDWTTAMLASMRISAEGDTMIVTHEDMWMQRIFRTGASTFTVTDYAFEENLEGNELRQPYYRFAAGSIYLTPSAGTGSITLTASSAFFTSAYVGLIMRLVYEVEEDIADELEELFYEVEITAYASSTSVTATVRRDLPSWGDIKGTGGTFAEEHRRRYEGAPWWAGAPADADFIPTDIWDEPVFSSVRGYARSVGFHGSRLFFGGSKSLPGQMFGSKINAFFNFEPGEGLDDEGISAPLESGIGHKIRHIVSLDHLQIMTDAGCFYQPQSDAKPVTPANWNPRKQTPHSCGNITPRIMDDATIFVQDNSETIREFRFSDVNAKYSADALSVISDNLLDNVIDMDVMHTNNGGSPEEFAFFVNGDGTMVQFHASRTQEIAAWLPWNTDGSVLQVSSFGDDLYMLVSRSINNSTVRFLEKLDRDITVDCAKTGSSAPATVFTGFSHLAGESVHVVDASGLQHYGIVTVSGGGTVTIEEEAEDIVVGLNYARTITDLPVDLMLPDGTSIGKKKRVVRVLLRVHESVDVVIDGQRVYLRNVNDDLSETPTAKTGQYQFRMLGWNLDGTVTIEQELPLKLTILSMLKWVLT